MPSILDLFLRFFRPGRPPETQRHALVCVDLRCIPDNPEAGHAFGLGLLEAVRHRGLACNLVESEQWILDLATAEGRFVPIADPSETDPFTGQARWELKAKEDLAWLLSNRQRLLSSAFAAGGDAEVVIVLHREDYLSLMMSVDLSTRQPAWLVQIHPADAGEPGFVACAPGKEFGPPVRFGGNAYEDQGVFSKLAQRLARR